MRRFRGAGLQPGPDARDSLPGHEHGHRQAGCGRPGAAGRRGAVGSAGRVTAALGGGTAAASRAHLHRDRPAGRAAEPGQGACHPGGRRLRRRTHRAGVRGQGPEGTDRARAARQGVCRIRQSVRCRHDRADRLLVGLPHADERRRRADAGHGLPLSCLLSQRSHDDPGGSGPDCAGSAHHAEPGHSGRRARNTLGPAAQAGRAFRHNIPGSCAVALPQGAFGAGRAGAAGGSWQAGTPAAPDAAGQRAGGRGCRVHGRRGHADRVGGPLPENERPTPAARFVQPRLDGQCHAAGAGCTGSTAQPTGDLAVGGRRLHNDDG